MAAVKCSGAARLYLTEDGGITSETTMLLLPESRHRASYHVKDRKILTWFAVFFTPGLDMFLFVFF